MLVFVNGFPIGFGAHAENAPRANVFVCVMNIGVGVVEYVVLHFPVEGMAADQI